MSAAILLSILSAIIAWRSICVIDFMSKKTRHVIRIAWVLLFVGGLSTALYPLTGRPSVPIGLILLMVAGFCLLCVFDKRRQPGSFGGVI